MSTFIFSVIILHLLAGFGYILYKLQPKKSKIENQKHNPFKKEL